jgi:hypothetical protein
MVSSSQDNASSESKTQQMLTMLTSIIMLDPAMLPLLSAWILQQVFLHLLPCPPQSFLLT